MKKAFAMKWADALDSGKYKQAQGCLYDGTRYCCLGVACVISGKKFVYDKFDNRWAVEGTNEYRVLPKSVMKLMGMKTNSGDSPNANGFIVDSRYLNYNALTLINDAGVKFEKIAQVIRDNYKDL